VKIVFLVGGGRAGSDFFHSLIDGHSQIIQFPGYLRVDKKLPLVLNSKTSNEIVKSFIKFYPEFFDSRKNKSERWEKLGNKKNKYFKIDTEKFKKNFIKIFDIKNNTKLDIIKKLHYAYFLTRNKKIEKKKILFIHTHLLSWTKKFIKLTNLKNFEILHTIRHPLASLSSPLNAWLNYQGGRHFFSKDLHYQIDTVVNCIYDLNSLGKVRIIQLERLHTENTKVMKNFCKNFKIKYEKCLKISSKNGLKWWGDIYSQKYLSGINKKFKIKINENYFKKIDLVYFQNLTKKIIKKYNYKFYYPNRNVLFNVKPMKCEMLVWKNTFKYCFYKGFRWKHILSIPIFYMIRILKFNAIFVNSRKNNLPKAF